MDCCCCDDGLMRELKKERHIKGASYCAVYAECFNGKQLDLMTSCTLKILDAETKNEMFSYECIKEPDGSWSVMADTSSWEIGEHKYIERVEYTKEGGCKHIVDLSLLSIVK